MPSLVRPILPNRAALLAAPRSDFHGQDVLFPWPAVPSRGVIGEQCTSSASLNHTDDVTALDQLALTKLCCVQQLQLRSADRPPTTPGSMRQSQSPRQALHHHQQQHHFQQQHPQQQQQQLQRLESLNGRPWRAHANTSAPMLDCPDVLPPESSEPGWHGQMLTTLGDPASSVPAQSLPGLYDEPLTSPNGHKF